MASAGRGLRPGRAGADAHLLDPGGHQLRPRRFLHAGGFAAYYLFAWRLNYFATLVLAVLLVGLAGVVARAAGVPPLAGQDPQPFIVCWGSSGFSRATAQLCSGVLDKSVTSAVSGIVRVGGVIVSASGYS